MRFVVDRMTTDNEFKYYKIRYYWLKEKNVDIVNLLPYNHTVLHFFYYPNHRSNSFTSNFVEAETKSVFVRLQVMAPPMSVFVFCTAYRKWNDFFRIENNFRRCRIWCAVHERINHWFCIVYFRSFYWVLQDRSF